MKEKSSHGWKILLEHNCLKLLLHQKFQDTFFCCLRHPELQFSLINGWWNDEKTTKAYFTRGAHKCEKCHLPSTIFPYLGVQVTSTFHALHCWVQNGSMTNFRITWRAPPHAIWDCILCHRSLNMLTVHEPMSCCSRCWTSAGCSYQFHSVWRWLDNTRFWTKLLKESRFSQFLLVWSQRWSSSRTWGFKFADTQSVDYDQLTLLKHLIKRK